MINILVLVNRVHDNVTEELRLTTRRQTGINGRRAQTKLCITLRVLLRQCTEALANQIIATLQLTRESLSRFASGLPDRPAVDITPDRATVCEACLLCNNVQWRPIADGSCRKCFKLQATHVVMHSCAGGTLRIWY